MPPRFSLLTRDGQVRADDAAALLLGDFPRFLCCAGISGVRVSLPQARRVAALRAYFLGTTVGRGWDSWAQPPTVPAPGALTLQAAADGDAAGGSAIACDEARWLWRSQADLPFPDGAVIELQPRHDAPLQHLILRFPPGGYGLLRIEPAAAPLRGGEPLDAPSCPPLPYYPAAQRDIPRRGDPLGEQIQRDGEASLQRLWRVALPFFGCALLGVVEGPTAAAAWDGGVTIPSTLPKDGPLASWLRHHLRLDLGELTAPLSMYSQRLRRGYLPIHEVRARGGGLRMLQTTLVDLSGRLRIRWLVENGGATTVTLRPRLRAARGRVIKAAGPSWPDLKLPDFVGRASHYEPLPLTFTPAPQGGYTVRIGDRVGRFLPGLRAAVPPGGLAAFELELPLREPSMDTGTFEQALHGTEAHWQTYLASGAQLDLPDPHFQDLWRALHIHNRLFQEDDKMRYGQFPGIYQGAVYGIEEGWNLTALAMLGQGATAQRLLASTFFDREFLDKTRGQHHQYRNGLCIVYAWELYGLTRDRAALAALYPQISESARWIIHSLRSTRVLGKGGQRPAHYGLMPKHTYGGDLSTPAYSLYGSSACWRGLRDAGLCARELGHAGDAEEFLREAALARRHLHDAAERIYKHDGEPPYLPFQTEEPGRAPSAGDYHQLFASMLLETAPFGWRGEHARSITDYLHQSGRQVVGAARFDQWFGRVGIDAEYTRGVQMAHLCRRDLDRFWLGVVGQVGLSCDPVTFTSPETSMIRFTAEDHRDRLRALAWDPRRQDSDPCSAGTAVMLQYLRWLLCFEERDEDDLPTGALWLAAGAPRAWFQPGQGFGFQRLPTGLGVVSLRIDTSADEVRVQARLEAPTLCELFYYDRRGARCSTRRGLAGAVDLRLPR